MLDAVLAELAQQQKLQHKQPNIWVAYSGGVDSHVLLHLAKHTLAHVRAIHINHNLTTDDSACQKHCASICEDLNIPLHVCSVQVLPTTGQSLETAARVARHRAWKSVLDANDILLLAHHADDQAETILFRLLRGSGMHGLSGMHTHSKLGHVTLLRPLLEYSKQDILNYARTNNLHWLEDASNSEEHFDRNFLRKQIMPLLIQRWPQATANINRAGKISQDLMLCLKPLLQQKLALLVDSQGRLCIQQLVLEPKHWQMELLRAWLHTYNLSPSAKHLQTILHEVVAARIDAAPLFQLSTKIIRRSKQKLYVLEKQAKCLEYEVPWDIRSELILPGGMRLNPERVFQPQQRARLQHANVIVRAGGHGRKAKKIFQQHSIPPWMRTHYPLIFADQRLVSIVGLWSSSII